MNYEHIVIGGRNWMIVRHSDNRIVFHFNKKHNEDKNIPQWVVKTGGETYYCDNVKSSVPFETKNTPDNPATKGSLMLRGSLRLAMNRYIDLDTCEAAYDAEIN